ncbi:MAG: metallophosphoesterase [Gemmataceae bacterium]|jgi:hypothetical protein|nr:metallophosphoesterase [Gemmataceae bacterium]
MADLSQRVRTLQRACELIRNTSGRQGRFLQLPACEEIIVVGDLHGHIENLQAVYKLANLQAHPNRHLIFQEFIHSKRYYPKGGDRSHQALDLFAALKGQFPQRVHLLMGNHELAQWTDRPVMKGDVSLNELFRQGVNEAYGEMGTTIYELYLKMFAALPWAIRTSNRVFISHSLPRAKVLDTFSLHLLTTEAVTLADLSPQGTIYELLWGRDTRQETATKFLQLVDCDWLITGHIPCEEGFEYPNEKQLIVDACGYPATVALISGQHPVTREQFRNAVRFLDSAE